MLQQSHTLMLDNPALSDISPRAYWDSMTSILGKFVGPERGQPMFVILLNYVFQDEEELQKYFSKYPPIATFLSSFLDSSLRLQTPAKIMRAFTPGMNIYFNHQCAKKGPYQASQDLLMMILDSSHSLLPFHSSKLGRLQ